MPRSKWNRKRKAADKAAKSGKDHKGKDAINAAGYKLNQDYSVAKQSSPKMEAYYSLVGLHNAAKGEDGSFNECGTDAEKTAERERFMSSLRAILPASFRIDRSLDSNMQSKLIEEMKEFVGKEIEIEIELPKRSEAAGGTKNLLDSEQKTEENNNEDEVIKRKIAPAKPIPFLSTTSSGVNVVLGYQMSVDRRTIRRNPSLSPLHEWLKIHTDCGHLTRQETVSMIPPVVLDAKPGMSVLDMCAAPGSKTCQLVEVVGGMNQDVDTSDGMRYHEPKGYVVANDADPKRAYMLVTQLRRLQSPSVFVTSCDGQYFPILDEKKDKGTEREGMFDRVLCDVPCSGDGTVRKNPGIWRHWNQNGALALHPLQLSIALRGARVTNVGGYLVYSTCSMNPMENESVVAELLRITDGSLVLEDPRPRMEGLVARPGWNTWKVLREHNAKAKKDHKKKNSPKMIAKRKEWEAKRQKGECDTPKEREDNAAEAQEEEKFERSPYHTLPYVAPDTWDAAALRERTTSLGFVEYNTYADVEPEWRRRVRASCFPPTEAEAKAFELHKCLRCLPHDMDTGGFFVALFKKIKPLSPDATARMHQMARESRGGIEVDAHLNSKDDNGEKKGDTETTSNTDADAKDDSDVVMTEQSEVEQTDDNAETSDVKKEEDETIQKAPTGRIGIHHNKKKKENGDLGNEDFIPLDETMWPPIIEEFGLGPNFPKEQYMARASGEAKVLYFIAKSVKEQLIDHGIQNRVTVINSGLKAFERCSIAENRNKYRISQEAIQFVLPYMTKRRLIISADDFYKCCAKGFMEFGVFSQKFQDEIAKLASGSFVVSLEGHENDLGKKMFLVMWKRSNALECFVSKVEMDGMISKLKALGFVAPEPELVETDKQDE
jgi:16S rRNA C967 or C1407 C5-methylase (RsmB/RsmF family)